MKPLNIYICLNIYFQGFNFTPPRTCNLFSYIVQITRILKNVEISYILHEARSFTVISTHSKGVTASREVTALSRHSTRFMAPILLFHGATRREQNEFYEAQGSLEVGLGINSHP